MHIECILLFYNTRIKRHDVGPFQKNTSLQLKLFVVSITSMQNANVIYHFKAEVLSFKAMYNNILFDNVHARNI